MKDITDTSWYYYNKTSIDTLIDDIIRNIGGVNLPNSIGYNFFISEQNLRNALLVHVYNSSYI
jgi:hypothetical protein